MQRQNGEEGTNLREARDISRCTLPICTAAAQADRMFSGSPLSSASGQLHPGGDPREGRKRSRGIRPLAPSLWGHGGSCPSPRCLPALITAPSLCPQTWGAWGTAVLLAASCFTVSVIFLHSGHTFVNSPLSTPPQFTIGVSQRSPVGTLVDTKPSVDLCH